MLRTSSQNSLLEMRSDSQMPHTPDPAVKANLTKESAMSSQAFVRTSGLRPNLAAALLALLGYVRNGLTAFGSRFMRALCETRQRQADQILRRYRSLIDE